MRLTKINILYIVRIILGIFFIFSSLIKLNDPLGLAFKLEEYFAGDVFNMPFLIPFVGTLSFLLIGLELNLGLMFILGFAFNRVKVYLLVLTLFFSFLTFYSAYFDKVTDCGCFGDAIPMTPWQSFFKNMILILLILVVIRFHKIKKILKRKYAIRTILILNVFFLGVYLYVTNYLPIVDFRDFAEGNVIGSDKKNDSSNKDNIKWLYRVDGQIREFSTEDAPWNIPNSEYVDRIQEAKISKSNLDFIVFYNGNEFTDSLLKIDKFVMVVIYQSNKANSKGIDKLLDIIPNLKVNIPIVFIFGDEEMKLSLSDNNIYEMYSDRVVLKAIIRSNPGILFIENKRIVKKWSWRSFSEAKLYAEIKEKN